MRPMPVRNRLLSSGWCHLTWAANPKLRHTHTQSPDTPHNFSLSHWNASYIHLMPTLAAVPARLVPNSTVDQKTHCVGEAMQAWHRDRPPENLVLMGISCICLGPRLPRWKAVGSTCQPGMKKSMPEPAEEHTKRTTACEVQAEFCEKSSRHETYKLKHPERKKRERERA